MENSEKVPLIVVLDDLQWADESSLQLLFRIGRRIENARVLVIGTYRPNDIAMGRDGERHPIEPVLTEMKRYLGDITIDLDTANEKNGRLFIEQYLRACDVSVDSDISEKMYSITEGHPLFVVELLSLLQARGDLVQQMNGLWQGSEDDIDWEQLPARVDGVIEERISRLNEEQLEILKGASVEGKSFTAEIVAKLLSRDSRELVREISRDLQRRHRLVEAEGVTRLGRQRLSNYHFSNKMVQAYLYSSMDEVEASFMHEDIAYALEELYGESADDIAVRLAWHFELAQIPDKVRYYLQKAGEQAVAKYADKDALIYLSKSLELTPEDELETRFDLLFNRVKVYNRIGDREAQWTDLEALESLVSLMGNLEKQVKIELEKSIYYQRIDDHNNSVESSSLVIDIAKKINNKELEARGYLLKARSLYDLGNYSESNDCINCGLAISRDINNPHLELQLLQLMGTYLARVVGNLKEAEKTLSQALEIAIHIESDMKSRLLSNLGVVYDSQGHYQKSYEYSTRALEAAREFGNKYDEGILLNNIGANLIKLGDFRSATDYLNQSIKTNKQIESSMLQTLSTLLLGDIAWKEGNPETGKRFYEEALVILQNIESKFWTAYALTGIGNVLLDMGELDEAEKFLEEAITIREELGNKILVFDPLASLAKLHLVRQEPKKALELCEPILEYNEENSDIFGAFFPLFIYHALFQVLEANNDPRSFGILEQVYDWLIEKANLMSDEQSRKMFLNHPAWKQKMFVIYLNKKTD